VLIPEFAPQSGIALTWPHALTDWRETLADIVPVYLDIARAVSIHERLLVICYDEAHRIAITDTFKAAELPADNICFTCAPSNDTWIRDYGPLVTERNGEIELHDFTFDGWDGKHPAALDNDMTRNLLAAGLFDALPCHHYPLVLEGGSIDTDGHGTVLTTSRCLLETGRNVNTDRHAIETALRTALGVERFLWLDFGEIFGDDTDGHVDMLARFCSPDTIAYSACNRTDDPHNPQLSAMEAQLETFTTTSGEPYRLVPLPLPDPCYDEDNQRLPASYANFLIMNDAVLIPSYRDPADTAAQQALQACFPTREVIPIDSLPLIRQHGSLHCATIQLPAGVLQQADGA
jgi:agmatine/peptidylarginine deiminase